MTKVSVSLRQATLPPLPPWSVLVTHRFSEAELRRLDLNLLLVFSAVVREGSVAGASERLHVGRTAVSMALGRLRSALDDPLFVRTGTGMEPTARAAALWTELEPALETIERAVRRSRGFEPATTRATFRFAAPDDLEFALVPRLVDRLLVEAPNARLVVRPSDFRTLLGRLDAGDADLALSATPAVGVEPRHRVRALHRERFACLHDPDAFGGTRELDLDAWLATPQAMVSIDGETDSAIDARLGELGLERRVLTAVAHFPTLPYLLRGRGRLANVPATAATLMAREHGLACGPLPFEPPDFEVSLAWHARTDDDAAHAWFRTLVEEEVSALCDERPGGTTDASPPPAPER